MPIESTSDTIADDGGLTRGEPDLALLAVVEAHEHGDAMVRDDAATPRIGTRPGRRSTLGYALPATPLPLPPRPTSRRHGKALRKRAASAESRSMRRAIAVRRTASLACRRRRSRARVTPV